MGEESRESAFVTLPRLLLKIRFQRGSKLNYRLCAGRLRRTAFAFFCASLLAEVFGISALACQPKPWALARQSWFQRRARRLAERVGFEPTVPCEDNGFRDRPNRPLSHLSVFVLCYAVGTGWLLRRC